MLADRVEETTTTAGNGNLTLAGASTNFRSFNTAFGTNRRFRYWIVDDTNNAWEEGVGYLSAASTLVRETILRNSSGTTSALTLGAGTKYVFSDLSDSALVGAFPGHYSAGADGKRVLTSHMIVSTSAPFALSTDYLQLMPFKLEYGGACSAMEIQVTTAGAASAKIRLGIYEMKSDGTPGNLLATTGDIDASSTGIKQAALAASVFLQPGWYFTGSLCNDNAVRVTKTNGTFFPSPLGMRTGLYALVVGLYDGPHVGWTTLPDPVTIDGILAAADTWGATGILVFS